MTVLAQLPQAPAQSYHFDSMTTEDLKVQVAMHSYEGADGATEFVPGSHAMPLYFSWFLASGDTREDADSEFTADSCRKVQRKATSAGDAVLYFSSVLHRGGLNQGTSALPRYAIDTVFHSVGRFRRTGEMFGSNYTQAEDHGSAAARAATWRFRTSFHGLVGDPDPQKVSSSEHDDL
eukprot:TRINITY_DN8752_c0_g1_i1.p1 TRINITY_DN8752_c0_g1~~TRINITY_DN8752_c0_g1_i1.p1  ORF type:complete len:178 (+),score=28.56 TRINITY_DN8752_c0_g1_i1:872-1405(+)